jgi:hypothetical protein
VNEIVPILDQARFGLNCITNSIVHVCWDLELHVFFCDRSDLHNKSGTVDFWAAHSRLIGKLPGDFSTSPSEMIQPQPWIDRASCRKWFTDRITPQNKLGRYKFLSRVYC